MTIDEDKLPTSDPITDDDQPGEPPAVPEEPDEDDPAIDHEVPA